MTVLVLADAPGPFAFTGVERQALSFAYTNHRGRRSIRHVEVDRIWFGSTEWHPEPQWLLRAYDTVKCVTREFALANVVPAA